MSWLWLVEEVQVAGLRTFRGCLFFERVYRRRSLDGSFLRHAWNGWLQTWVGSIVNLQHCGNRSWRKNPLISQNLKACSLHRLGNPERKRAQAGGQARSSCSICSKNWMHEDHRPVRKA